MHHRWVVTVSLAAVAVLLLLCGCSGSASARFENGHGSLVIHLTDSPLDLSGVQGVVVTVTGVVVYPGETSGPETGGPVGPGSSPIVLASHPATFDLLTLTGGATALLASGEVPAGEYGRIRLEVSKAVLEYRDGSSEPLKIESAKVEVPIRFRVVAGSETGVTLDFDAAASVQVNGTGSGAKILRPVVTPAPGKP